MPVIELLVKPGDAVKKEDSLVTLESDKATMEVPSPAAGVVKSMRVKVGDKVSEGSVVLLLEADAAGAKAAPAAATPAPAPSPAPVAAATPPVAFRNCRREVDGLLSSLIGTPGLFRLRPRRFLLQAFGRRNVIGCEHLPHLPFSPPSGILSNGTRIFVPQFEHVP